MPSSFQEDVDKGFVVSQDSQQGSFLELARKTSFTNFFPKIRSSDQIIPEGNAQGPSYRIDDVYSLPGKTFLST